MPTATKTKKSRSKSTSKSKSKTSSQSSTSRTAARTSRKAKSAPAKITNYATALRWLYSHIDHERMRLVRYNEQTFNLDRMHQLLELIDNPHEHLPCVHIAGTKGKGSTCAMLASMLEHTGYTIGVYTSPHLVDLRERVAINGNMISYNDIIETFKLIASTEDAFDDQPLTFFEIMTATAFKYFADQAVDIAILEVGLGGRLDCTNVCNPLVTAVTHLSHDHTNILGDDIAQIAREKAGIFKPGVPALSVEQVPEAAAALKEVAEQAGATLEFTGEEIDFSYRFEANKELGPHTRVCLSTTTSRFEHLPVPLSGEHQAHNCGLALAILDKLRARGYDVQEDKVIEGLADTKINGRMEMAWTQPRVILDGAHNATSVQALIRAMGAHITYDSLVMIFGCGQDKDIKGMLEQIALGADKVIFTRAKANPKAVEPEDLHKQFAEVSGKMAQTADSLEQALRLAASAVSREDLIVVTGSFYLAGEGRKYFLDAAARS